MDERTTNVSSLQYYNINYINININIIIYYITYQHVNSKLGRQHTKAPLAAAIGPFFYELNY